MPKIREAVVEATFYLFRQNPKVDKIDGPFGTGFFVIRPSAHPTGHPHIYAVTNWHVARDAGASIIRVNTRDGKSRLIKYEPHEWKCPANGDDLAIIDVTRELDPNGDEAIGLYEDMFLSEDLIRTFSIGVGDDAFMCGLFVSHHGGERNVPVIRFGNLSMMATAAAPVELETGASRACFLMDTRSRTGFSGSPVFLYRTATGDLTRIRYGWTRDPEKDHVILASGPYDEFWGLLGIHCGQFWDTIEVRKTRTTERLGDSIAEGDKLEIQSGMTIVIPAWRIKEFIDSQGFEMARQKREDEGFTAAQRRPRGEAAAIVDDDVENPRHLDDFKRLIDVAARKKPKD
jgi:hypothetical protein